MIKYLFLLINLIYGKYLMGDYIPYSSSHRHQLANLSNLILLDEENKKIAIKITLNSNSFLSINNELIISNYDNNEEFAKSNYIHQKIMVKQVVVVYEHVVGIIVGGASVTNIVILVLQDHLHTTMNIGHNASNEKVDLLQSFPDIINIITNNAAIIVVTIMAA